MATLGLKLQMLYTSTSNIKRKTIIAALLPDVT